MKIEDFIASITPHEPKTIETKEILSKAEIMGFNVGTTEKVLSRMARTNAKGLKRVKQGVYTLRTNFRPEEVIGKSKLEEIAEVVCPLTETAMAEIENDHDNQEPV